MRVLFVCTGNICRSPMAEVIFYNMCKKNKRTDIIVKGAGTGANEGEFMTLDARKALKACGEKVDAKLRPSTLWTDAMLSEFDHIVCMTQKHKRAIDADGKYEHAYTLDSVVGCGDILDPWMCPVDVYIQVCKQLQDALKILYGVICKK